MEKIVSERAQAGFEPLSGMDAGFLYMETPTNHLHTLKVAIMRPSEGVPAFGFDLFKNVFARKIARLPSFRRRIRELPLGHGHPVWVDDPDFDLSRHLSHRTVAAPGGMREVNAIVSEVASRPLPRDRPLWEITMVDGLEGGRVAFVCKLHHAMADGAASMAMLLEVLGRPDRAGSVGGAESVVAPIARGPRISLDRALRRWAARQWLWRIVSLPKLLLATFVGVFNVIKRVASAGHRQLPAPFSGPRTRFSGALTERRSFGTAQMSLAEMKRVKNALDVTLNDVFLAVCGGALRGYLHQVEGGIPNESLLASVPVNTDSATPGRTHGNHVGNLSVSLCTHVADPIERVRAIHEMTDEAKQRQLALGPDLLERWVEYTPPEPYMALTRFWSGRRMADRVHPPMNLVVSNVPGPRNALDIGGYALEALYSVGPILQGIGLNLTGWSYGDQVFFVGLACPDQIEDIQALVDRLPVALAELIEEVEKVDEAPALAASSNGSVAATPGDATRSVARPLETEETPP